MKITNFQTKFGIRFSEAWGTFQGTPSRINRPHHGFTELHQLDTLYNALTQTDQDSLNAVVSGNLLTKTPRDASTMIGKQIKKFTNSIVNQNSVSKSLNNKEKLFELAKTPVNENCSAVILKKLPEKLGDPGKFLIPCDFPEIVECLALADLDASINLMPLSIWKKLSLPELTPNQMILKLADRSSTSPSGIAEDVFIKVEKFHFLADFVVVDYIVDPRVPLILGRPFLRMAHALIDVYSEELTLRVDDEAITFKVGQTSRYSYNDAESVNQIDVTRFMCMMAIFHDMIEETMEVFMDDFSIFGNSFSSCLSHLDKMLKRCEDTNLVLNWEKYHFMVKKGIVLGHKILKFEIEVDKAKVDIIAKLPHLTSVKGV
ncbi:reverse transcriptase domain-containing protein [Tanacetum coccineum]